MTTAVKTLRELLQRGQEEENLITQLVFDFIQMEYARAGWVEERREALEFIDATDTRTTTNSKLPFKNSTTIPKLAQIYQNMLTAYMEHLMPNREWIEFQGASNEEMEIEKRKAVNAYVRSRFEGMHGDEVMEELAEDYIQSGIAIVHTRHVKNTTTTTGGTILRNYTGCVAQRINPTDFFYDVTANNVHDARKCIRVLYTTGGLLKEIKNSTNPPMTMEQFEELLERRQRVKNVLTGYYNSRTKFSALHKQGFGDVLNYIRE